MSKLIDMHFHLDFYANHRQVYNRINQMEQHTLCVTNQPEIFESCIELYKPTKYVQFGVGFHPQNAGKVSFGKASFLRGLSCTKYVGEVGLDFSKEYLCYKDRQMEIFNYICQVSRDKIMSIHCRMAEGDIYRILKENNNKKVVMHWYSGDEKWMEKFIELGCFFSINSNMVRSNTGKQIINQIPINRIFVESDGPFTKVLGRKYTVEKLSAIYEELACVKKICEVDVLKRQVTHNYLTLMKEDN